MQEEMKKIECKISYSHQGFLRSLGRRRRTDVPQMSHRHNVYCKENYQITDRQNVLHNTHTFNKSNSIFQTNTQNNLNSSAPLYSWYLQGLPVFHAKQFFYYVYTVQPFEESCLITDYCIQLMSKHVDKYTKYS